jgi:deazaflavin-dependent oxidoreductase (nitroreductase family)
MAARVKGAPSALLSALVDCAGCAGYEAAMTPASADRPLAARLAGVAGRSTCRLTHHGRRTGRPYEVTIWFMVDGETVYLGSANVARQWARNVRVRPEVELRMGGERFQGDVSVVADAGERAHAEALLVAKYWYVRPLLWLVRTLEPVGWRRRDGYFRVRLAA